MTTLTSALPATSRRFHSLDGLRGLAALIVVISHAMITSPVIADALDGRARPEDLSFGWWITYTPLHLLWAGTEAVFVFFILSGFVLVGPTLRPGFSWAAYYRQRLPRLYLPVWASLLFASMVVALTPREVTEGASWWTNDHQAVQPWEALVDATLLGTISKLNSPLWSLTWEVWFSLLLPIYVIVAQWAVRAAAKTVLLLAVIFGLMSMFAFTESVALRYLPMFALGVLMFLQRDRIFALARHADRYRWVWPALTTVALLLLASHWLLQATEAIPSVIVSAFRLAQVVGAALIVSIVLCWRAAATLFEARSIQWLGSRSFSLYLTHDPIVSTTAFMLGGSASPFVTLALSLPIALVVAEVFFRVVERPSHLLAKRLGRSRRARGLTRR